QGRESSSRSCLRRSDSQGKSVCYDRQVLTKRSNPGFQHFFDKYHAPRACYSQTGPGLGIHFFNPVPMMKLVELIKGNQTSESTVKSARGFVESLGKTVVQSIDKTGFIVN